MSNLTSLVYQQIFCGLCKENAILISRSRHGLRWILKYLNCWILQRRLMMFDWEYLAIKEKRALEFIKDYHDWLWLLLPAKIIEKTWNEMDEILYEY
jgi:hypothetical protein